jgi:hypothetical protein
MQTKGRHFRSGHSGVIAVPIQTSSALQCREHRGAAVETKLDAAERRVKGLEDIIVTQAEQLHKAIRNNRPGAGACVSACKEQEEARLLEVCAEMEGLKEKLRILTERDCGCVGCLDAPATNVMIPCGHLLYCDKCAPKSRTEFGDVCTVCDAPAKQFKIYPM